jgi:hypothetical protein
LVCGVFRRLGFAGRVAVWWCACANVVRAERRLFYASPYPGPWCFHAYRNFEGVEPPPRLELERQKPPLECVEPLRSRLAVSSPSSPQECGRAGSYQHPHLKHPTVVMA